MNTADAGQWIQLLTQVGFPAWLAWYMVSTAVPSLKASFTSDLDKVCSTFEAEQAEARNERQDLLNRLQDLLNRLLNREASSTVDR